MEYLPSGGIIVLIKTFYRVYRDTKKKISLVAYNHVKNTPDPYDRLRLTLEEQSNMWSLWRQWNRYTRVNLFRW